MHDRFTIVQCYNLYLELEHLADGQGVVAYDDFFQFVIQRLVSHFILRFEES